MCFNLFQKTFHTFQFVSNSLQKRIHLLKNKAKFGDDPKKYLKKSFLLCIQNIMLEFFVLTSICYKRFALWPCYKLVKITKFFILLLCETWKCSRGILVNSFLKSNTELLTCNQNQNVQTKVFI